MSMKLMANGVPSSQVNENITTVLDGTEKLDKDMYNWPDATTYRRWRYGMRHVCEVQIGMELTRAANNKKQVYLSLNYKIIKLTLNPLLYIRTCTHTRIQVLTGDGTPVSGKHVECFVITVDDVKIAMLPWVQAGKTSLLSAENTVKMIDRCQRVYNNFYKTCKDKEGLPTPVTQGSLILNVAATVNDAAPNETCRVGFISKIRERVAAELDRLPELEGMPLVTFYCSTHKVVGYHINVFNG